MILFKSPCPSAADYYDDVVICACVLHTYLRMVVDDAASMEFSLFLVSTYRQYIALPIHLVASIKYGINMYDSRYVGRGRVES